MTTLIGEVARDLQRYAKAYAAGAFATPTCSELEARPELITENTRYMDQHAIVIARRLIRESRRADFTGGKIVLPAWTYVATHVAHSAHLLPDTRPYDYVFAYAEDHDLTLQLAAEGRRIDGYRISAASEVIQVWGPPSCASRHDYPDWDLATVLDFGPKVPETVRPSVLHELDTVSGWDDDFPYYSDGSWSAVCLKGFWPEDPGRGVKPSEMPESWKRDHPDDLARTAQRTVLADRLPVLERWAESLPLRETERVRLLRMGPGGRLGRHTDITDRDGGTRDGQIVRFHIPLVSDPGAKLITWDLDGVRRERHLQPWHLYYLDARKPHAVVNDSAVNRIHLVIDAVSNAAVRGWLADGYRQGKSV